MFVIIMNSGGAEASRDFEIMCDKELLDDKDIENYKSKLASRKFGAALKIILTYSQILSLMLTLVSD